MARFEVVGAGPNGLAAAVELARAGHSVRLHEAMDEIGGGTRTAELTLPGFRHDICSGVHPMGKASPYFRSLPLADHGLEWIQPPIPMAHPFDDGTAALLHRSAAATAATLDRSDDAAYRKLMDPFVERWEDLYGEILAPPHLYRHPLLLARFGLHAVRSATGLSGSVFDGERARALFTGIAAHALLPPDRPPSGAFGMVLAIAAHAVGWPISRGGSQRIADALAALLRNHGGEIVTGSRVDSVDSLPESATVLLNLEPHQVLQLARSRLPERYVKLLEAWQYGPGIFKMDWALSEPIPWRATGCERAGTIHLGGSAAEITASSRAAWEGRIDERPFVLLAQPTLFDESRAPSGRHVAWGYCHVPRGSDVDLTDAVEAQIERFAPGFKDVILERSAMTAVDMERHNENLAGDLNGGVNTFRQLFMRPAPRPVPYATPNERLFICSASTPPGGSVHGMCGYHAAHAALRRSR